MSTLLENLNEYWMANDIHHEHLALHKIVIEIMKVEMSSSKSSNGKMNSTENIINNFLDERRSTEVYYICRHKIALFAQILEILESKCS